MTTATIPTEEQRAAAAKRLDERTDAINQQLEDEQEKLRLREEAARRWLIYRAWSAVRDAMATR